MIQRAPSTISIEGPTVTHRAGSGGGAVPLRVDIDLVTGLIADVGPITGRADLSLGEGHWIFPGFIDVHVHAREDTTSAHSYKETFETAGLAAIHGGVTAYVDMPNNPVPPVDDASYAAKRELTRSSPVDVLLYAGIGPNTRPLTFRVPYKAYMGPSVGDLFFSSYAALREALARYRGQRVAFHAEDPDLLAASRGAPTHSQRRPPEAEVVAVERALELCEGYQIDGHICHLSTQGGLELIRAARRRGQHVTCEVTPHHLFYDLENSSSYTRPGFLQCNPPLRSRLDRIALLEAFKGDEVDYLATDHAPHSLEENERGVSGVPHLDTYGAFIFWLIDQGVRLETIRQTAAERPGKFLSHYLPQSYGKIEKGYVGSLTILRRGSGVVRRSAIKTRAGWSPFEGVDLGGEVSHTIVRGHVYPAAESTQ